jgi:hypothetical protein
MFAWVALGWSVATLAPSRVRSGAGRRLTGRPALAGGLACVAAVGAVVAATRDPHPQPFDEVSEVTGSVDGALPDAESVRVQASFGAGGYLVGRGFEFATIYSLRRSGRSVSAPDVAGLIGKQYDRRRTDAVANIDAGGAPGNHGRAVARVVVPPYRYDNPFSKATSVTVTASVRSGATGKTAWLPR